MNRAVVALLSLGLLFAPLHARAQQDSLPPVWHPLTLRSLPAQSPNLRALPPSQWEVTHGVVSTSADRDPMWVTALGLTFAAAGLGAFGYSQGYLGGVLLDTPCFERAGSVGKAGLTGGVVLGTGVIVVALPISFLVRRGRGEHPREATSPQPDARSIGFKDIAMAAVVTTAGGSVIGAIGGAIVGGDNPGCDSRAHAAWNAALHVGAGGFFTWPLAFLGP